MASSRIGVNPSLPSVADSGRDAKRLIKVRMSFAVLAFAACAVKVRAVTIT